MGKPTKRPRLASKSAASKLTTSSVSFAAPTKSPADDSVVQRTKDEKRQARHDAFLKKIKDKKPTKKVRKRPKKKTTVSLLSLESSLEDIISKDREARSKRMEVSVRPKGKQIKQEVERFKAVMQHSQFKSNPLKTIRQHFQNTWETKEGMKV